MKNFTTKVLSCADILFLPFILLAALLLKAYRRLGSKHLRASTKMLKRLGVFPIIDQYYEPMFNDANLTKSLADKRVLPGLDFRENEQLKLLEELTFQNEFDEFLEGEKTKPAEMAFCLGNGAFESGDAEFLFNFIRHSKPRKVVEIGCGSSTKLISHASQLNEIDTGQMCNHICIEPYEQSWLEGYPKISLMRSKVEDVDCEVFESLEEGDFLFIDSSHIIRPQGDVLHEYLRIIPTLSKGVTVHVHDIFTPRDYLDVWLRENVIFWNEQYLLEAMLSKNSSYEVVAALNLLKHEYFSDLKKVCQYLTSEREPGSFYFRVSR
ncbi:MAG: class I SAM-dependent methyltransferase [Phycisphaerales bacterium]|nr:class I SAM-dependent methyltransferase [Phycisphaerales bacterium]